MTYKQKQKEGIRAFRRRNAIKEHKHKCRKCHAEWICDRPNMDFESKEVCSLAINRMSLCDKCLQTV